ncbi:hypothetical protein GCM10012283_28440 [Phycicoccus endophyticus]|nr:hypothetical protein GCM10012283_28440 [Phycicoccus endophyticus]
MPRLRGSTAARVQSYLWVNVVGIWFSVLLLVLLRFVIGPSDSLRRDVLTLAIGGTAYGVALVLARRGRLAVAAGTAVGATWFVAFALTWTTPFLTPVALLVLHIPSLVLTDAFRPRTRRTLLPTSVLLTGALVMLGESRREGQAVHEPPSPMSEVLVGVFTVLVAAIIVVGIRDAVARLARQRRELEESRARLAVASIEARRAIERDLHDGAQQRLTALAVDIGRLGRVIEKDPVRARELAHGLQPQLEAAIRELRDLAHGIYPTVLAEQGLAGALSAAARRTRLPCLVDVDGVQRYPRDVEAAVYFCCLEAMQNADRHSGGSLIRVTVAETGAPTAPTLTFTVTDDGCGFDVDDRPDAHGLTGMRDRGQSAHGVVTIRSAPGAGTTVEGRFPRDGR